MNKNANLSGVIVMVLIAILIVISSLYVGALMKNDKVASSEVQWIVYDTKHTEESTMYMSVKMGDGFMLVPLLVPETYILYIKTVDPFRPTKQTHVHVSKEEFSRYEVGSIYTGGVDE